MNVDFNQQLNTDIKNLPSQNFNMQWHCTIERFMQKSYRFDETIAAQSDNGILFGSMNTNHKQYVLN